MTILTDISAIYISNEGQDMKTTQSMVQGFLETLHAVLKYVSEIVRKALQVGAVC